ncbi:carbonic anhydrase [Tolypothrix sp. FACHB-123]|uniref:carbonic anhydrase n=1 Tax=Tolypothrix sp. FACHB-123 TaxID=2692868 RepID=UPI0016853E56|nr:carbonic anhydrase [Tolypothrix sp. FACHB-123]MBD2356262.1 carbonic anhydrase [Tolypothrix sp. FACHB-123]
MARINGFIGRRNFLHLAGLGGVTIGAIVGTGGILWNKEPSLAEDPFVDGVKRPKPVNPQTALNRLIAGNQRFTRGKRLLPRQSKFRLQETVAAQYPFAAILGCADSRVPAEIVFDQGLGDLFVVRVAGNIASPEAIGSLEYATSVLGTQLILVLGHAKCGAVHAAVEGKPLPGRIGAFVEEIKPAVEIAKKKNGSLEANTIIANVQYQAEHLAERSTILGNLIQQGKLKIVGGYYDLATGKVTMLF